MFYVGFSPCFIVFYVFYMLYVIFFPCFIVFLRVLHVVRDFFPCFIVFLRVLRGVFPVFYRVFTCLSVAINRSKEQTETKVWHHNGVKVGWSTTVVFITPIGSIV